MPPGWVGEAQKRLAVGLSPVDPARLVMGDREFQRFAMALIAQLGDALTRAADAEDPDEWIVDGLAAIAAYQRGPEAAK